MASEFNLYITTPEKVFFKGAAESVVLTSTDGEMGVLRGHTPMVVALTAAPLRMKVDGEWKTAAIIGGFASIKEGSVAIFADTAEWPDEIEEKRALDAKRRAEERLQARASEIEYLRSRVALERALARLAVKRDYK